MATRRRLSLYLSPAQERSLRDLVVELRNDSLLRALQGEATPTTALRYLVYAGLDQRGEGAAPVEEAAPVAAAKVEAPAAVETAAKVKQAGIPCSMCGTAATFECSTCKKSGHPNTYVCLGAECLADHRALCHAGGQMQVVMISSLAPGATDAEEVKRALAVVANPPAVAPPAAPKLRPAPGVPQPAAYSRPPHWEYYDEDPWELPDNQSPMHAYYTRHGWMRCATVAEGRAFHLYWVTETAKQGLKPFPAMDARGRKMQVQSSPDLGTAHIIPEDWGEAPDDAGSADPVVWRGGS